jgi:hypothetical protein
MARYNLPAPTVNLRTVRTTGPALTHEGGQGFARDPASELLMLAVNYMAGESTFYESAIQRDDRFARLVREVAVSDPDWIAGFLPWLRTGGNLRTASIVAGAEAAKAWLDAGRPGGRTLIASVIDRPDEPGEFLAYWASRYGLAGKTPDKNGRMPAPRLPMPVKRGVGDAALRIWAEYGLLKYDTPSHGWRFGDVLELTHPGRPEWKDRPQHWQRDLFEHAIDRRHNRSTPPPDWPAGQEWPPTTLAMIRYNGELRELLGEDPTLALDTQRLKDAGMTWEDALSLVGSKVDKRQLWEALIPVMGYMALLRNLRNFDEAGVSDRVAGQVLDRLTDPGQVARSRQFPYRYLAAYEQAPSQRWGHGLDLALQTSLANLPALPGRSAVLIDTSASMEDPLSAKSKMSRVKAAAVFGVALALRNEAELYGFASGVFRHKIPKGASLLREITRFVGRVGEVGHGTEIAASLRQVYNGQDRVFVITDMQTFHDRTGDTTSAVPREVPFYGFNLGGYKVTAIDAGTPNRTELGGLGDSMFKIIPLIESGARGELPWA